MKYQLSIDSEKAVLSGSAGSVVKWDVSTQFFRGKRQVALSNESGSTLLVSNIESLKKILTHRFPFLTDDNLSVESSGDFL